MKLLSPYLLFSIPLLLASCEKGASQESTAPTPTATPGVEPPLMVRPADVRWVDAPSMAPPAKIAVLEGDLAKAEPFTMRVRLPTGYKIAPHTHPIHERVTVLSGTFHIGHGRHFDEKKATALPAGSLAIMGPGRPMYVFANEETIIQVHGVGPWDIQYLNEADDPRARQ